MVRGITMTTMINMLPPLVVLGTAIYGYWRYRNPWSLFLVGFFTCWGLDKIIDALFKLAYGR